MTSSALPGDRTPTVRVRVEMSRLSDQIADQIEAQILHGDLDSGERLPSEAELCAEFDVSRSVIRDALRTLDARGLVEARPGRGTIIRAPNQEALSLAVMSQLMRSELSMADVVSARATVDIGLVPLAAERASDDQIATVRESYDAFSNAVERELWEECSAAHVLFHVGLIDAVNTPALSIILSPMQHVIMLSTLPAAEEWHRTWAEELPLHEAIIDSLTARNTDALHQSIARHYDWIRAFPHGRGTVFRDISAVGDLLRSRFYRTGRPG